MNAFLIWGMIFFSIGFVLSLLRLKVLSQKRRAIPIISHVVELTNSIPIKHFDKDGTKYYLNCVLHRENGPAVEMCGGVKEWYLNGKLHREDGPAIEYPDGSKEWFLYGFRTKVEWADGGSKTWWEVKEEREARKEEFEDDKWL